MRVIQVGIGGMGNAWINAVNRSEVIEFAGFVEVSEEIAAQQVSTYNLDKNLIFKSLPEALEKLQVDGIINVTPPQFHREISVIALEAGIPVLSEKPLAGTLEDAQAIVNKANETGILHMVTQNYRYSALAQTVKSVLSSGKLGTVASVDVAFYKGPHFGGFREEMRHPLIIDMAIHHFDLMRFFLDSNPKQIYARSWNPVWSWYKGDASATVDVLFENNIRATYNGSWCSQGMETTWNGNWRFECEKGALSIEDDQVYIQHLTGIEERPGYRHIKNDAKSKVEFIKLEKEQQDYLLQAFYDAVVNEHQPETTAQDNIHTVNFVFSVVEACDTKSTILIS